MPISQAPIFIVGFPRSGTTLLQSMMCTQPDIVSFPETHFFSEASKGVVLLDEQFVKPGDLPGMLAQIYSKMAFKLSPAKQRQLEELAQDLKLTKKTLFETIIEAYCKQHNIAIHEAITWLEKTPAHALHLNEMLAMYPQARFVAILRHPVAAVGSCITNFSHNSLTLNGWTYYWRQFIKRIEAFHEQHPEKLHLVKYEDLVIAPGKTMAEMFGFLQRPFDPSKLLEFGKETGKIIVGFESWKHEHADKLESSPNQKRFDSMPKADVLTIQRITEISMRKYRYDFLHPLTHFKKKIGRKLHDMKLKILPKRKSEIHKPDYNYADADFMLENDPFQAKGEQLSEKMWVGGPLDSFGKVGRIQLITLLKLGLVPSSKVLDVGCGMLRGGYWLIHFLNPGCYHGIEPNKEMIEYGIKHLLEPNTHEAKKPVFDHNAEFDFSIFSTQFDFIVARSVWTHASKNQIKQMLLSFSQNSGPKGVFLTSYLKATKAESDFSGEKWEGRSHESAKRGIARHSFDWIERICSKMDLSVRELPFDVVNKQVWLRIQKTK